MDCVDTHRDNTKAATLTSTSAAGATAELEYVLLTPAAMPFARVSAERCRCCCAVLCTRAASSFFSLALNSSSSARSASSSNIRWASSAALATASAALAAASAFTVDIA